MAWYSYSAKTKDAQTIKDTEEAATKEELIAKLRARGLFIVSIKESGGKKSGKGIISAAGSASSLSKTLFKRTKRSSVTVYDMAMLAHNLATTLSSGVALLRGLEILSVQSESGTLERILRKCSEDIKAGLSLSEAINKYPNVFNNLWRGIIEVGEASGNLPFVLERLAEYLEMRMEFERKIKGALVYPIILFVVAIGATLFFFKVILPKFTELFTQFNVELPLPTKILFALTKLFEHYFLLVVIGLVGLVIAIFILMRQPAARKVWDRISLQLPVLGQLTHLACLERFTSTIYILLDSGLPLVYTLEVSARGVGNSFLEKKILTIKDKVKDGESLSAEFSKQNIFPLLVSEMAKIGEETGSMPDIFQKISVHYQKDLSSSVDRLITLFEPIMIIFMGLVIGGLVISLFLPLFKLATIGGA